MEGWNHKINSQLGRPHPKVKDLIKSLKSEAEEANHKAMRMELNLEGVKRKKSTGSWMKGLSEVPRGMSKMGIWGSF